MNEWQEKALQRSNEFAAILEAIMVELPGTWELKPWPNEDVPPRWRQLIRQDQPREILAGSYQASGKERIEFKASGWPEYTDETGREQTKDPSNLWNPKEVRPVCTAAIDRPAEAVAKQVARLFPDYDRIYERCEAIAKEAQEYHDRAGSILSRLAEATGNPDKPSRRGNSFYLQELPGDIVSVEYRSPGDVKVGLDGEEMLEVIKLIYRLRQSGQGPGDGSAEHEPTAAELQTVIDAGIAAIQQIVNNWESGDLAGAVNGGEDWATQAADWLPDGDKPASGPLMACPECGCTDVQTSAWIEVNGESVVNDEGPLDTVFCPQCEHDGREGDVGKTRYLEEADKPWPFDKDATYLCGDCNSPSAGPELGTTCRECGRGIIVRKDCNDHNP